MSQEELKNSIKKELNQDYAQGKLDFDNLMTILFILSECETKQDLELCVQFMKDKYSCLEHVYSGVISKKADENELDVHGIVKLIIKDDPLLASEVSEKIMKEKLNKSQILQKYPQIQSYLN